jgi:enoyl-CoA hydratase
VFGARRFPPKPAIAAISGWCLGGGVTLATWCDLRIAADTARFGFPDRQWGVPILDGGTDRLAAIIGLGRALDLVLTGREISAATALAMGLVTEVVAPGEHVTRALEIAERIASFPQATLLADRWGLLEGLDQRMEFTAQRDVRTLNEVAGDAEQASARFTSGGRRG